MMMQYSRLRSMFSHHIAPALNAKKQHAGAVFLYALSHLSGLNRGPHPSLTPQFTKSDIWGLDCILRIPFGLASLVSRSGLHHVVVATVLTPHESLTVIQDSLACFRTSGQEVNATYHGCALPTELRWLLSAAAIRLLRI